MTIDRQDIGPLMSQAVIHNGTAYLAGMVPDDFSADIKGQTEQVLTKIERRFSELATDKTKMLSTMIWLKDIKDRDAMNEVWTGWIDPAHPPVRACVQAELANPDILIEIMVTVAV